MTFRVLPPWWRRRWVLAAAFVLLAAGTSALWWWRNRRLLYRSHQLARGVEKRTEELKQALAEQRHLAAHDDLTGLPNQRSFWESAHRHEALAKRHRTDLALADSAMRSRSASSG